MFSSSSTRRMPLGHRLLPGGNAQSSAPDSSPDRTADKAPRGAEGADSESGLDCLGPGSSRKHDVPACAPGDAGFDRARTVPEGEVLVVGMVLARGAARPAMAPLPARRPGGSRAAGVGSRAHPEGLACGALRMARRPHGAERAAIGVANLGAVDPVRADEWRGIQDDAGGLGGVNLHVHPADLWAAPGSAQDPDTSPRPPPPPPASSSPPSGGSGLASAGTGEGVGGTGISGTPATSSGDSDCVGSSSRMALQAPAANVRVRASPRSLLIMSPSEGTIARSHTPFRLSTNGEGEGPLARDGRACRSRRFSGRPRRCRRPSP